MQLAEIDHEICFSQSYGLLTTKYKFWFTVSKHLINQKERELFGEGHLLSYAVVRKLVRPVMK